MIKQKTIKYNGSERKSGVLMHISSLYDKYGIGTFGQCAFDFADFLKKSRQSLWQILPINPIGKGNSPYSSPSAFAIEPLFIDLTLLKNDGYIDEGDLSALPFRSSKRVNYTQVRQSRKIIFEKVYSKFKNNLPGDFDAFCRDNEYWLNGFAEFMCKNGKDALYHKMLQYFAFKQWNRLKKYANSLGIKIIGDMPIYVSYKSADVFNNPDNFLLDENKIPTVVSGCPPDAFTKDGQLWGNPVYNWKKMKQNNYGWWAERLAHLAKLFDIIRIDHFRGFEDYYAVPFGEKTAVNGKWFKGPSKDFFKSIRAQLPDLNIIAEDLGNLTPAVKGLLEYTGYPGMKILQFAFDSRENSDYLPHNYDKNSVCYTGTHDNNTTLGWIRTADENDILYAKQYFNVKTDKGLLNAMVRGAFASVSNTVIIPVQDILELGSSARMNTPSTVGSKNWSFRADKNAFTEELAQRLSALSSIYKRNE